MKLIDPSFSPHLSQVWFSEFAKHDGHLSANFDVTSLQEGAIAAIKQSDIDLKTAISIQTAQAWFARKSTVGFSPNNTIATRPGRPDLPKLLPPNKMKKRSIRSERGRTALIHAIAHIELNAMDLAWDIVARFAGEKLPRSFFDGWVRVAYEEAKHFTLLRQRLALEGLTYGDFPAHDGLWEAAQDTKDNIIARLAIVPLVLEARGLDVTPSLIEQLTDVGDHKTAEIFQIIYADELGHVAVGAKWFRFLCLRNRLDPVATFQIAVRKHFRGQVKPPFNDNARSHAGLTPMFYRHLSARSQ